MEQNPHFSELLQRLSVHNVEFLIVHQPYSWDL